MDFEIKEEPLYDTQFQLESGQQFIAHNGNGYESCEFCDEIFGTKSQKNLHIFEHFDQEICTGCDQRLIRIGASLFVLHTKMTCVTADNDTPATIEQSPKYPWNEIFIKGEMEPSVLLPIGHNMQSEERLPHGMESIFFDGIKIDSEPDILLDQNNHKNDNQNLNDEDHVSSEKLNTTTIDVERDVSYKVRSCDRIVRKKRPVQHKKSDTIHDKNQQNLTCDICHKSTISSRKALKRHKRLSHRPKDDPSITTYTCDYCQIELRGRPLLHRHMKLKHDPDYVRPKCEICKKTFNDEQKRQKHEKSIHLDERFVCSWCDKSFKSEYNLKIHQRIHTGETPFKCSFDGCSNAFRSKDTLARHRFTHTGQKQCKCDVNGCERLFLFKNDMNKHKRRFHMKQPELSQFVCFICGNEFKHRSKLVEHERIHTGERPFKCGIVSCGKTFRTASLLSNHKRYHSNQKRYRCDHEGCEKAYAFDIDLKRHKYGSHGI